MKQPDKRDIVAGGILLAAIGAGLLFFRQETLTAQPVIAPADSSDAGEKKPISDDWQVIYLDNQRIGYARTTTIHRTDDEGRKIIRTRNETHMTIQRFGQELKMTTLLETDETESGDLLRFDFQMQNPPADTKRTIGRVGGKWLLTRSEEAGRTQTRRLQWDAEAKSPAYQDRLMQDSPMKPGEKRSFKTFLPEFHQFATVTMTADEYRPTQLHDGTEKKLLKIRIRNSVVPTMTTEAFLDPDGEVLRTDTDFAGMKMTTYTVSRAIALEAIEGAELDLAVNTLVPVTAIRKPHRTREVVYRITTSERDPVEYVVEGETQKVKRLDPNSIELTVTALKPPVNIRLQEKQSEEYLKPTQLLQADDRDVMRHARSATAGTSDPGKMAIQMEQYVHKNLNKKNFSTALASAAEVAKKLEGDCTEHAVLLAAMLRAKNIPSRIAVGLVYVDSLSSFGGHMWTEAWLGDKWIPLDATLGKGGIGAAHIKLGQSSCSDDGPAPVTSFLPLLSILGNMKIEVVDSK